MENGKEVTGTGNESLADQLGNISSLEIEEEVEEVDEGFTVVEVEEDGIEEGGIDLDGLKDKHVCVMTGVDDFEVEGGEVEEFYEKIVSDYKSFYLFDSSHDLPQFWTTNLFQYYDSILK